MAVEVEEFINQLNEENEAYFANLPETDTVYWADRMDGLVAAEALKPRWYNEIRGVEIIGRFIGRVPDLSLKALVGRQVGDEAKHALALPPPDRGARRLDHRLPTQPGAAALR